jgi:hypothetical protein
LSPHSLRVRSFSWERQVNENRAGLRSVQTGFCLGLRANP